MTAKRRRTNPTGTDAPPMRVVGGAVISRFSVSRMSHGDDYPEPLAGGKLTPAARCAGRRATATRECRTRPDHLPGDGHRPASPPVHSSPQRRSSGSRRDRPAAPASRPPAGPYSAAKHGQAGQRRSAARRANQSCDPSPGWPRRRCSRTAIAATLAQAARLEASRRSAMLQRPHQQQVQHQVHHHGGGAELHRRRRYRRGRRSRTPAA